MCVNHGELNSLLVRCQLNSFPLRLPCEFRSFNALVNPKLLARRTSYTILALIRIMLRLLPLPIILRLIDRELFEPLFVSHVCVPPVSLAKCAAA